VSVLSKLVRGVGIGLVFVVFAMILYPHFAKVYQDRYSSPLPQIKQNALALLAYANDHDEKMPDRDVWMDRVSPYLNSEESLHAPEIVALGNPGLYGFAFNSSLSGRAVSGDAAGTPLVYDSVNLARNASDPYLSLPYPGRRDGKDGVAFADGHVGSVVPDVPHR